MLIYTQPGNCNECSKELVESTTQIPGQEDFSVYICPECNVGINPERIMIQHDQSWMFEEYPDKYSMWECCVDEYKKVKRRADLWNDLKHVLRNSKWNDSRTIEAVLTNMDYIEKQVAKSEE